jgi:glycosyltransferase involved in cell wall biosynthesis
VKVLYIVTAYDRHPGDGITPWLVETIRRLAPRGIDVEVLAPAYRGLPGGRVDGVMVHRFRYAPRRYETLTHDQTAPDRVRERPFYLALVPPYLLSASLAARRLARDGGFDVVHAHWPLPHVVPGWVARRAAGLPLVITFHGVELTFARTSRVPLLVPLLRRAVRTADAVTANSTYTAGLVRELYDRQVDIVPFGTTLRGDGDIDASGMRGVERAAGDVLGEGVDRNTSGPGDVDQADASELLFVGRLVERKGVQVLLGALDRLRDRRLHLSVVGDGAMRPQLEARSRELGLEDRVTFHGFVSPEQLARRFKACDAFVLPAVRDAKGDVEGLGVVLIEALTLGRPVVASDAGGIPDIVRHEETGLLVPPGDEGALARAIARVLDDPSLGRRLGEQGRRHVAADFSWPSVIARLEAIYSRLLGQRQRG